MQRKLWGIINVDSDAIGQLLITDSVFVKYLRKKWEHNEAVHQLKSAHTATVYVKQLLTPAAIGDEMEPVPSHPR